MGKTGTQSIGDHMWRTLYSPVSYGDKNALIPTQLGNDKIKWESTVQKDLGLDFSFMRGRLGGTFGYYHKVTDGTLLNMTPAPSSSYSTVVFNIAKIRNQGLEFDIHGDFIRKKDFRWTGSLNISRNVSKVLDITVVRSPTRMMRCIKPRYKCRKRGRTSRLLTEELQQES